MLYGRREDEAWDNYSKTTRTKKRSKRSEGSQEEETSLLGRFLETDFFSCNDVSTQCSHFALAGSCQTEAPYMAQFCPRSCGTCPRLSNKAGSCADIREGCESYVSAGYCSFFSNYMRDNCARTCGFCSNTTLYCQTLVVDNGAAYPSGAVIPGLIVEISCEAGFQLHGSGRVRCGSGGDYDSRPGACLPRPTTQAACSKVREYANRQVFNARFGDFVTAYDVFSPSCNEQGLFDQMQCYNDICWCVEVISGEEIPRTRGHFSKSRPCNPTPRIYRRYRRYADLQRTDDTQCSDVDELRCRKEVAVDPSYCYKYPADAIYTCRKSCKLCAEYSWQTNEIIKVCPTIPLLEGYTEPYHPVLPGNSVHLFCEGGLVQRVTCQEDGAYLPRPLTC